LDPITTSTSVTTPFAAVDRLPQVAYAGREVVRRTRVAPQRQCRTSMTSSLGHGHLVTAEALDERQ